MSSKLLVHSIEEFCPDVKTSVTMPDVVQRQKAPSYKAIFIYLYQIADEASLIELDAAKIGRVVGLSRKSVYKVIAFLKRVNLIRLLEAKKGRGRHSIYFLNWKKQKHQTRRKCHPLLPYRVNVYIHPTGDSPAMNSILSPANQILWKRCMSSFRSLLKQSRLGKTEQRLCMGVLGRKLKGKERAFGLKLYGRLQEVVKDLHLPVWARVAKSICAWFMGLLKELSQSKERPPKIKCEDLNELLWELARQEKERIMKKRAPFEKSWEERLEEWKRSSHATTRAPLGSLYGNVLVLHGAVEAVE